MSHETLCAACMHVCACWNVCGCMRLRLGAGSCVQLFIIAHLFTEAVSSLRQDWPSPVSSRYCAGAHRCLSRSPALGWLMKMPTCWGCRPSSHTLSVSPEEKVHKHLLNKTACPLVGIVHFPFLPQRQRESGPGEPAGSTSQPRWRKVMLRTSGIRAWVQHLRLLSSLCPHDAHPFTKAGH